jgi:hypothetical protein
VWCGLTHERVIGSLLFDRDIITSNSCSEMLENYPLSQLNNNKNNIILQLDGTPVNFRHNIRDCLNVNFPG